MQRTCRSGFTEGDGENLKYDRKFTMNPVAEAVVLAKPPSRPLSQRSRPLATLQYLCEFVASKWPYVHITLTDAIDCISIRTGAMRTNLLSYYSVQRHHGEAPPSLL